MHYAEIIFDGATPLCQSSDANMYDLPLRSSPYTIELYIRIPPANRRHNQFFVTWGTPHVTNGFIGFKITQQSSLLGVTWWANDLDVLITPLTDDSWHHVATTYDGNERKIFLDFKEVGSDRPGVHAVDSKDNLCLGTSFSQGMELLQGNMKKLKIWNVALSGAEMQSKANGKKSDVQEHCSTPSSSS